jgi:hypothetical protein
MTFAVVMTEATAMCTIEMIMKETGMCRLVMMKRLPTTVLLVMKSRMLSRNKTTTLLRSPMRCPYRTGWNAVILTIE